MSKHATEISLTRKLRQLMGIQEISLSPEEAELYNIVSADILEQDSINQEKGENDYEHV